MASSSSKDKEARFMAEIFKVVYKGKDEVEPDKQLGTIIIRNRKYHHYIYDVDDADMCKSSIKSDGELTLTGPTLSPITCPSGFLIIDVDLFCGAYEETIRVNWLPSSYDQVCYYDVKRIKSKDGNGEIFIYFGIFYCATEALIEVSLLTMDNSVIDCGGFVAAHTSENDDKPEFSSLLFSNIKVQSGEPLPFSRSIVAVPLESQLFVKIDLSSDDQSVKFADTLKFKAILDGTEEITLDGSNCKIDAKVTWNDKYHFRGDLNDICYYSDEAYEL